MGVWRLWARAGASNWQVPETVFVPSRDMSHADNRRSGQNYSYTKDNLRAATASAARCLHPASIIIAVLVEFDGALSRKPPIYF